MPVMSSYPFRFRRSLLAGVAGLLLAGNVAHAQTPPLAAVAFSNEVEASLVRALETLKVGGIKPALREIDLALEKNPNFRLGHLIKGDLLMAKSGSPVAFGGSGQPELVASLRDEARMRLNLSLIHISEPTRPY